MTGILHKSGVRLLTEEDMDAVPMWYFDDETDLYYPVHHPSELPDYSDHRDLRIRVVFFTPSGFRFKGYIIGIENIFCIGIFVNGKEFLFNCNLLNFAVTDFKEMMNELPERRSVNLEDAFPMRFETSFDFEGYNNFSDNFDLLRKARDPNGKFKFVEKELVK